MKKEVERDINAMKLYDMLLNYLKDKKYPSKIKDKVNELNTCLISYINSEENDGRDMIGSNYYLLEKGKSGALNKMKLDEDCFLFSEFLTCYIDNKYNIFSDNVLNKVNELIDELNKNLPQDDEYLKEDSIEFKIIEEIEYEEPKF